MNRTIDEHSMFETNFEQRTVGSSEHVEYWIPAEELASFNRAIQGLVEIEEAFFRSDFRMLRTRWVWLERE